MDFGSHYEMWIESRSSIFVMFENIFAVSTDLKIFIVRIFSTLI